MRITRYSLGHKLLCAVRIYEPHLRKQQHTMASRLSHERREYRYGCCVSQGRIPLQLLPQPGQRLCHGCRASQERINESAVSRVPQVSFQPLSSHLAYPGFSKQCITNRMKSNSAPVYAPFSLIEELNEESCF